MAGQRDLDFDTFLVLARQAGLDVDDEQHLRDLFPEVQAMFQRIGLLQSVDTTDIQLGPSVNLTPGAQGE